MKILISTESYRHHLNGVANSVITLTDELRKKGHDVRVIALSDTKQSYREGKDYYFGSSATPLYPDLRFSFINDNALLEELIDWQPDIIHIQTEFSTRRLAMKVARRTGAPFVMTFHTNYEDYTRYFTPNHRPLSTISGIWFREKYRNTSLLIAPSYKVRFLARKYKLHCPIAIVPNGIALDNYQKQLAPDERNKMLDALHIKNKAKVLSLVSRISREKNIIEIINYMPALLEKEPEATLVISGDGPYFSTLKRRARLLHLEKHIVFTGRIPFDEVYKYYQLGNVFVCASTFETQGLTYVEALASGMPMVCRKDLCLKTVIDPGKNGFIYKDRESFVEYVTAVLEAPALQRSMSEHSYQKSFNFNKEKFSQKIERLYQMVLNHDI